MYVCVSVYLYNTTTTTIASTQNEALLTRVEHTSSYLPMNKWMNEWMSGLIILDHSFVCSFVRSFVSSFVCLFTRSYISNVQSVSILSLYNSRWDNTRWYDMTSTPTLVLTWVNMRLMVNQDCNNMSIRVETKEQWLDDGCMHRWWMWYITYITYIHAFITTMLTLCCRMKHRMMYNKDACSSSNSSSSSMYCTTICCDYNNNTVYILYH